MRQEHLVLPNYSRTFWTAPAFTELFTFSPLPVSRSNAGALFEWIAIAAAIVFFTLFYSFQTVLPRIDEMSQEEFGPCAGQACNRGGNAG